MTTLLELVQQASSAVSMYKNPDIDEAKERLSEILIASGQGGIMNDHVESIELYKDEVRIDTSWSCRGCSNSSSFSFPISILEAEDPIKAATIWGLNKKINEAQSELNQAQSRVQYFEEQIAKHKAEMEKIMS